MSSNRGKAFEKIIYDGFNAIPNVSIDRIPDQTMKYKGRANVSDFIVYHLPYEYYVECKTVHGNRLPFANIPQFDALLKKSEIAGVRAGIMCWWVDHDITRWLPIEDLELRRKRGNKSIAFDEPTYYSVNIFGRKKKVFFEYDLRKFLKDVEGIKYE